MSSDDGIVFINGGTRVARLVVPCCETECAVLIDGIAEDFRMISATYRGGTIRTIEL